MSHISYHLFEGENFRERPTVVVEINSFLRKQNAEDLAIFLENAIKDEVPLRSGILMQDSRLGGVHLLVPSNTTAFQEGADQWQERGSCIDPQYAAGEPGLIKAIRKNWPTMSVAVPKTRNSLYCSVFGIHEGCDAELIIYRP